MTARSKRIPFAEAAYSAGFSGNPEYAPRSLSAPLLVDGHARRRSMIIIPARTGWKSLKVQEIPSGYDASHYATERLMVAARDGKLIPVSVVYRKGFPRDGSGRALSLRLWRLWHRHPAGLLDQPDQPARPRLCLRHRPYPRRRRSRLSLVSRRQAREAHQHLQRFRRRQPRPDRRRFRRARPGRGAGRLGRRRADGRDRQPGDPELYGAIVADVPFVDVLNTMLDDTPAADAGRMARMGQSDHGQGRLRADPELQPLRQCRRPCLSADADDRRPQRSARHLLGAGQMGGEAARRPRPTTICSCSRSTWAPAMAASPAAGSEFTRSPRLMASS